MTDAEKELLEAAIAWPYPAPDYVGKLIESGTDVQSRFYRAKLAVDKERLGTEATKRLEIVFKQRERARMLDEQFDELLDHPALRVIALMKWDEWAQQAKEEPEEEPFAPAPKDYYK